MAQVPPMRIPVTVEVGDRLDNMFAEQADLQRRAYGAHPSDITDDNERIQFIKDMNLALQDELHEFLAEIGWKPWATSRHVNEDAAKGELVDAFHFFMNLCMAVNMDAQELYERYLKKRKRNEERQKEGYDGVSTKCPACHKGYDDGAVSCHPASGPGMFDGWCGGPLNIVDVGWDYTQNKPLEDAPL